MLIPKSLSGGAETLFIGKTLESWERWVGDRTTSTVRKTYELSLK